MKPIRKLVATVGKYTDNSGQEKNRYQRVGTLFQREDGSSCMKLDCLPVGPEFNGWVNIYPMDDQNQGQGQQQGQQQPAPQQQPPQQSQQPPMGGMPPMGEDDIPF